MRWQIILLFIAFALWASCASAFPLSGSSITRYSEESHIPTAITNITVFGTIGMDLGNDTTRIYVDVGAPNGYMGSVSLVDDEDKFYNPGQGDLNSYWSIVNIGWGDIAGVGKRFFIPFDVPKGTVIKRLKFEPSPGEPISISWEAVPEVSNDDLKLKMYGVTSNDLDKTLSPYRKAWIFDIKLTNNLTTNMPFSVEDFSMVDQYGWVYGWEYDGRNPGQSGVLTSGESMRFDLTFSPISGLSRPVMLKYKNLSLDISAWT